MKPAQISGVLLLVMLASSCSNVTPFVITGKSLAFVDNQFADTAEAFNKGLDEKKVTPEQYRVWAAFGNKFKPIEKLAYTAWNAAVDANDQALAGHFGAAIGQLAAELLVFYNQMKEAGLLPAGAP